MDYVPDVTAPNLSTFSKSDLITYETRPEVSGVDPQKLALFRGLKIVRRQLKFQLSVPCLALYCFALPTQDNNKVTHLARGDQGGSTNFLTKAKYICVMLILVFKYMCSFIFKLV